jgi:hypothetical protein
MPGSLWPEPKARAVVEPQTSPRPLFLGYFEALPAPDALNPVLAHPPAADPQQCGDPAIAVTTILRRKRDNGLGQRILVSTNRGNVALGAPRLADDPAGMSLR